MKRRVFLGDFIVTIFPYVARKMLTVFVYHTGYSRMMRPKKGFNWRVLSVLHQWRHILLFNKRCWKAIREIS